VLVYEPGTIGAKPVGVSLSIGDGELAETADFVVSVPEMFNYWIQPGRIQVVFLGAAIRYLSRTLTSRRRVVLAQRGHHRPGCARAA
jgi:hypothetical protein